ncbi:MAG: hypothetical protein GY822_06565 [Deltaproteobacteria bacterium]|nr:hypothetical protein [Deltaproteobacteria bacterium]
MLPETLRRKLRSGRCILDGLTLASNVASVAGGLWIAEMMVPYLGILTLPLTLAGPFGLVLFAIDRLHLRAELRLLERIFAKWQLGIRPLGFLFYVPKVVGVVL